MTTYVQPHMAAGLQDHVLTQAFAVSTDRVKLWVFRLRPPDGSRLMGCEVMFTSEGIVILGDLTPTRRGVISDLGYGLGWFGSTKSEDYLCSKFLTAGWHQELVGPKLDERVADAERELAADIAAALAATVADEDPEEPDDHYVKNRDAWKKIRAFWNSDETSQKELHEFASDLISDFWDEEIGHGYKPSDAGWLCAIQQRFAALHAKAPAPAAEAS